MFSDFKRMGFYSMHEVWTQRGNLGSGDGEGSNKPHEHHVSLKL
jgi:hypothetical protein